MLGAAMRLVAGLGVDPRPDLPLVTGSALGMAMLAVAQVLHIVSHIILHCVRRSSLVRSSSPDGFGRP